MASTTVTCECDAEVNPGLLHYDGGFLRHRLTEHICPVCGVVMYTTGGGFRPFVRPLFSTLIPALLFLYAYFCVKTGNWGNGLVLGGVASIVVYYSFPAFARKSVYIGATVLLPLFFLRIAAGVPGTGGKRWVALLFFVLAAAILYFSHRVLACELARRFHLMLRGNIRQNV